ncbi:MAG: Phosphoglycolate phosphatase [Hydrocarboniphaga sp.]|uniref:HAD family hydrolase n=1 Tax=Hydrocarboniphaga sp. TaxID=2033016 RepID=UPI002615360C|nr:HAD-IA family hydrolase [Hydrocarboniphaga sp.]MDB5967694.1 Phosphoglycolate phosphatase [Hydrocarboniphaga sp.]
MTNKRFELLIFDWDGTLADSAAQIVTSMQSAIAALKLPERSDHEIRDLIGLGMHDVLYRLFPELDSGDVTRLLAGYREAYLSKLPPEAPLFAGALEGLRKLHSEGYQLAVATGKSRPGLNRSLAHHTEVRDLLVSSRTADETASKPDPLMLKELLQELDLPANKALMVGDTEYDAHMAAAVGMPMVGVICGVHDDNRLRQAGAEAVLEYAAHLPLWLVR